MSTKTTIKRIALVAAASLGLGVLSVVPSQASIDAAVTVTATAGSGGTIYSSDSTTAASIAVRYFATGGPGGASASGSDDTVVVSVSLGTKPSTANLDSSSILMTVLDTSNSSGSSAPIAKGNAQAGQDLTNAWTTTGTGASGMGTDSRTVANAKGIIIPQAVGNTSIKFGFFLDTRVQAHNKTAGTYTFDYVVRVYTAGILNTALGTAGSVNYVLTSGATVAASGAVSAAGTSTALMAAGNGTDGSWVETSSDSVVTGVSTPSLSVATAVFKVTQLTSASAASQESITASTTIGNIGACGGTVGKSVVLVGNTNGINYLCLYPDGNSGVAKVSIKTTSVTFSDKQVTFYSTTVSKIEAGLLGTTLGGSSTAVILAKAYDAAGNQILDNTSVYAYSDALTVINTGTSTGTACSYVAAYGGQLCSLTGAGEGTANITLRNKSTVALSTVSFSTGLSITVNKQAPVALKLAFDKASYAPGEVAYIRLWAVDAAGKVVAPGTYSELTTSAGVTSSVSFGNSSDTTTGSAPVLGFTTAAGNGYASVNPIRLYKVYMPYTGGTVTISVTGGTALPTAGQVAVTASATVADNGAAALAAVTALASQVSAFITKINAQITTLTDLVMKIQKKVKA